MINQAKWFVNNQKQRKNKMRQHQAVIHLGKYKLQVALSGSEVMYCMASQSGVGVCSQSTVC